jgi:hypothetical protein
MEFWVLQGAAAGWRAWCSGDLSDDWAEVVLSERVQISESLAEE